MSTPRKKSTKQGSDTTTPAGAEVTAAASTTKGKAQLCELCAKEVEKIIKDNQESQNDWEKLLQEQKEINASLSASLDELSAQLDSERRVHKKELELLNQRQKLEFAYYKRQIELLETLLSINNGKDVTPSSSQGESSSQEPHTSPK